MKFLKSDTTWQPELINENKYLLRANKDLNINVGDFEDYLTGVNFDVPSGYRVVFKSLVTGLVTDSSLSESNYYAEKSTVARLINRSNDIIQVRETEYILSFGLIGKLQEETQQVVELKSNKEIRNEFQTLAQEPTPESDEVPTESTLELAEEPTPEPTEQVQEPTPEPTEQVQEPTPELDKVSAEVPTPELADVPTPELADVPTQESAELVEEPKPEPVQPKKRKYVRRTAA